MEDYRANSKKSKELQPVPSEKKIEKVIEGTAKVKKKGELRKFTDVFISEDASNVKGYIFSDVLVPAVKKLISDIVKDGIEMVLYGTTGGRREKSNVPYVAYNRFSDKRDDRRPLYETKNKVGYSSDDIILGTRSDAEEVICQMRDLIDTYGVVSVADLYEMVNLSHQYTDNKYGWMSVRDADIVRVRDGYLLKLPRPKPID